MVKYARLALPSKMLTEVEKIKRILKHSKKKTPKKTKRKKKNTENSKWGDGGKYIIQILGACKHSETSGYMSRESCHSRVDFCSNEDKTWRAFV